MAKVEDYASAAVIGAGAQSLLMPQDNLLIGAGVGAAAYYLAPQMFNGPIPKYALAAGAGALLAPFVGAQRFMGAVVGGGAAVAYSMYEKNKK